MDRSNFPNKTLFNGKYKMANNKEYFIGNGSFGEVFKAKNTETGELVAIKRINKENIKNKIDRKYIEKEIKVMVKIIRIVQIN